MTTGNDDKRRAGDADDLPPSGDESRAQGKATSMPVIWLALGLALVVLFVVAVSGRGLFHTGPAQPAPVKVAPVSTGGA